MPASEGTAQFSTLALSCYSFHLLCKRCLAWRRLASLAGLSSWENEGFRHSKARRTTLLAMAGQCYDLYHPNNATIILLVPEVPNPPPEVKIFLDVQAYIILQTTVTTLCL